MSLAKHFWNALLDLAEVYGGLEGNDGVDVDTTDVEQTLLISPRSRLGGDAARYGERAESNGQLEALDAVVIGGAERRDEQAEKVIGSEDSVPRLNCTDIYQDRMDESSNEAIEKISFSSVNTHTISQDLLSKQSEKFQEERLRHLKWQDKATMAIQDLKDEVQLRKDHQRTIKQAALREQFMMRHQMADLSREIRDLEVEKVQMAEEQARVVRAHAGRLQEVEARREEARRAAVEAEERCRKAEMEHEADMRRARSEIQEPRAGQTFTFTCRREVDEMRGRLAEVEKEKKEELAVKEEEMKKLRDSVADRDATIHRLRGEVDTSRQIYEEAMAEKARLHRAKMDADGKIDRLRTKNEDLMSKKGEAEARASGAECRAKGLQDQLAVARKGVDHWRSLYTDAVEDARDRVLGAYAVAGPQNTEEDSVEKLRKEKAELEEQMACLKREWREAWEKAV